MRISDWSSDVCSSDLNRTAAVSNGLFFAAGTNFSLNQREPRDARSADRSSRTSCFIGISYPYTLQVRPRLCQTHMPCLRESRFRLRRIKEESPRNETT